MSEQHQQGFLGSINRASGLLAVLVVIFGTVGGIISLSWQSERRFEAMQNQQAEILQSVSEAQSRVSMMLDSMHSNGETR